VLENKPVYVDPINEAYTSSIDPFIGKMLKTFYPSMMRYAWRGERE